VGPIDLATREEGFTKHPYKQDKQHTYFHTTNLDQHLSEQELFEEETPVIRTSTSTPRSNTRKRSSVGRFPISPNRSPPRFQTITDPGTTMTSRLEAGKRIENRPALVRQVKTKDGNDTVIDFWADVCKFDNDKLEAVMSVASAESDYDLTGFIRGVEYQGFNRLFYIKHALSLMSVSLFVRFAILGAIRGSNFQRIIDTCEIMPQDMINAFTSLNFVKTPKKKDHLTILRNTASIPHWCAFYMVGAGIEKKVNCPCPAAIQFPGAASLPMSKEVRLQHIEFCMAFSALLPGGAFRMSIYLTAMGNQIPVSDIHQSVLTLLKVSSNTEAYKLTEDDVARYSSALITTK
jgi:hypothetical protein